MSPPPEQRDNTPPSAAPADRPRPWSYEDLRQRLERLPRGHPSSPYNADGSRRPPPPDLRALELPRSGEAPPDEAITHRPASAPDKPAAEADRGERPKAGPHAS